MEDTTTTTETHQRFAVRCPAKAAGYLATMERDVERVGEMEARRLRAAMTGLRAGLRSSFHCLRCGKSLTDPASVTRGLGPDCSSVAT